MSTPAITPADLTLQRETRLIWLPSMWPEHERTAWTAAQLGTGPAGRDNPAATWCRRTAEKNEDGYGRYLCWLYRQGLMVERESVIERMTPERFAGYVSYLKSLFSSASVGATVGGLTSAARALAPDADWSWLSRRSNRLKLKAKPSRDKRHAMRHTLELYEFGKHVMDTADPRKLKNIPAALRYQSGLIIALLAARPLRVTT